MSQWQSVIFFKRGKVLFHCELSNPLIVVVLHSGIRVIPSQIWQGIPGIVQIPPHQTTSAVVSSQLHLSLLLQKWRSRSWSSSPREDRGPATGLVTLRLSSPTGLSSEPPWSPNGVFHPHLSKMLQTLDCVAKAAIPPVLADSLWNHLSLIERSLCLCFRYLIG